ncbi:MAG TPA: glycosyltransferase family 4 protein [Aggregatilineales bacterium]|nr:glycosyltransferase family 4 protein [Anaerolineales bacterium]HRE47731.1 glycosyltransferase family 4 protein [Aggregatilineales bacterium]
MRLSPTPRNLLYITIYSGIGGGETLLLNLMGALDRDTYRQFLITPQRGKFPEKAAALGVQTVAIPFRGASTFFVPALWGRFPITQKLRHYLREQHIDAVISDYHALPFIVPAAESLAIPVLWTIMGWWFPLRRWQRAFFERHVAGMTAITANVKSRLLGSPPKIIPERIAVHIPGVDVDTFAPNAAGVDGGRVRAQLGISPETPLVAMAARFQAVKGHEVFQDVVRRVAAEVPDAHFVASGDNVGSFKVPKDEAYKADILQRANDDPILRQRLTYLGFYPDVRDVIAAADVMVCSSHFESLLMVAVESMAMGRPIVSTEVGGPSETIRDGETGYLVPPADGVALAERVITLLRDPALRQRMGAAGRAHAVQNLSVTRYAATISAMLEELMQRVGRG